MLLILAILEWQNISDKQHIALTASLDWKEKVEEIILKKSEIHEFKQYDSRAYAWLTIIASLLKVNAMGRIVEDIRIKRQNNRKQWVEFLILSLLINHNQNYYIISS